MKRTTDNNLPCRLRLYWNRTLVMDGTCSRVMACDTTRAFFAEQFAGSDFKAWLEKEAPHFNDMFDLTMPRGASRQFLWLDATGSALAHIELEIAK